MDTTTKIELGKIAAALAKAQAAFPEIKKDCTAKIATKNGGSFSYTYASLATIRDAVTPHLAANGLALTQTFEPAENGEPVMIVVTTLIHESGESIQSRLSMPLADRDPKTMGSAITYGRRYGLSGILGVAVEEDDDGGNGGTRKDASQPQQRRAADVPPAAERAANACASAEPPRGEPAANAQAWDKTKQRAAAPVNTPAPAVNTAAAPVNAGATPPPTSSDLAAKQKAIGNAILKYLADIPNEQERKGEAVKMLGVMMPGKKSTTDLSDLDCDRVRLGLVLLQRVPGGTIKDVNAYLTGQWTMGPIHELTAHEINSAYTALEKQIVTHPANPIADDDIPF